MSTETKPTNCIKTEVSSIDTTVTAYGSRPGDSIEVEIFEEGGTIFVVDKYGTASFIYIDTPTLRTLLEQSLDTLNHNTMEV